MITDTTIILSVPASELCDNTKDAILSVENGPDYIDMCLKEHLYSEDDIQALMDDPRISPNARYEIENICNVMKEQKAAYLRITEE